MDRKLKCETIKLLEKIRNKVCDLGLGKVLQLNPKTTIHKKEK